jgi:aminoglycoside phosphotransferase
MFWHSPGFEDQRWIVPLDHAGGPAMLLKRRLPTVSPRLLQKSVELLMRSPMVRRRLAISLIGRRGPIGHTGTFAHRFAGLQGVPRPYLVATPSFPSSRTVVFLMEPGASHEPTLVAKIARVEGGAEALRREADNLRAVHRDCETVEAPRLRAHAIFDRHAVVLESAVPGRLMQPRIVRRAPAVCIDAVMRWLEDLHRATRMPASDAPGRVMTLIESPLARLEPIVAHDPWAQELLLRVRRVTSRLASPGLPLVFEHGDLSSPNLLIQPDGRAGVLDWELAHPHGLPAVDLFFFLAFVAFARERATTPDECVNAFRQAFFGPSAWARPYIERYAALVGVPTPALRPLFLLCWSRYLAQLPDRMAWAVGRGLGPAELADVRRDRYWHLWKYAVEHCDAFE